MFDQSFSYILAIAALVIGIMILTGHGSVFMKVYVVVLFVILAVYLFVLRTKCLKK